MIGNGQCAPFVFTAGFGNDGIADVTSLTTNPLSNNGGSSKIGISTHAILLQGIAFASVDNGLAYSAKDFTF